MLNNSNHSDIHRARIPSASPKFAEMPSHAANFSSGYHAAMQASNSAATRPKENKKQNTLD